MAGKREVKTLAIDGIGFDEVDGIIEGLAAVTGNVDAVSDRIVSGAFAKTISDNAGRLGRIPMGADHEEPLGITLHMEEVGRDALPRAVLAAAPDATGGLYCKGQVVMMGDNLERLDAIRGSRTPLGMSITYRPIIERKAKVGGRDVRDLVEVQVYEWGPALRKRAVNGAAQVTSVKSASSVEGSFEDLRDRIGAAIRDAGMWSGEGESFWIRATMPDHVLVTVFDPTGADQSYRVDYAEALGQIVLGATSEVDLQLTVTEKAAAELGLHATIDRAVADMKAGRVLSKRNLDALEVAIESLRRIHAAAMGPDTDEAEAADAGDSAEGKATIARLEDTEGFQWDLELTRTRAAAAALAGGMA